MVKRYIVYIKSHYEVADSEFEFNTKDLKDRKCKIKWAEDFDDVFGTVCNGKLVHFRDNDLQCNNCGAIYNLL